MNTKKINDSVMEVTKDAPVVVPMVTNYNIDFLHQQELDILKSMNDFVARRQGELDEVRGLIAEAEKLGLKTAEVLLAESVAVEQEKLDEAVVK